MFLTSKSPQRYSILPGDESLETKRLNHPTLKTLLACCICSFLGGILLTVACFSIIIIAFDNERWFESSIGPRSPVPPIPWATRVFEKNETYSSRPSRSNDRAWDSLLPPGRGFVFVENGAQYGYQPGQETPWGGIYSVSLFHQLHCLGQMRAAHWTLVDGISTGDLRKAKQLMGNGSDHIGHCLDYLRQGVMCAGDMAMEWPRTEPDGRRVAVDGWGATHVCRSWDAIEQYMDEAHFNYSTYAGIAG